MRIRKAVLAMLLSVSCVLSGGVVPSVQAEENETAYRRTGFGDTGILKEKTPWRTRGAMMPSREYCPAAR